MPKLRSLDLSENLLQVLPPGSAFNHLNALTSLDLSYNKYVYASPSLWSHKTQLQLSCYGHLQSAGYKSIAPVITHRPPAPSNVPVNVPRPRQTSPSFCKQIWEGKVLKLLKHFKNYFSLIFRLS